MAKQAELQLAVAGIEGSATEAKNEIEAAIQRLEQKIVDGAAEDLQPEIDRLKAVQDALDAIRDEAKTKGN